MRPERSPARHILALDQGTTSSRAIVFDHDGLAVAAARKEFRQIFPKPGWVEHDPHEIWSTQMAVAVEALGDRTEYALEGSIFVGGAVVQWLRDGLGLIANSADVEMLASGVPDNGGVFLVPAFAGRARNWIPAGGQASGSVEP